MTDWNQAEMGCADRAVDKTIHDHRLTPSVQERSFGIIYWTHIYLSDQFLLNPHFVTAYEKWLDTLKLVQKKLQDYPIQFRDYHLFLDTYFEDGSDRWDYWIQYIQIQMDLRLDALRLDEQLDSCLKVDPNYNLQPNRIQHVTIYNLLHVTQPITLEVDTILFHENQRVARLQREIMNRFVKDQIWLHSVKKATNVQIREYYFPGFLDSKESAQALLQLNEDWLYLCHHMDKEAMITNRMWFMALNDQYPSDVEPLVNWQIKNT